jgi:hypothetical protein
MMTTMRMEIPPMMPAGAPLSVGGVAPPGPRSNGDGVEKDEAEDRATVASPVLGRRSIDVVVTT